LSDTDLHTVSDAQQQEQTSSDTLTLAEVESLAATLADTDPFNIADLESLDAGDPPLQVEDSDTFSVAEDEFISLSDTDVLTVTDAQETSLADTDVISFADLTQQSTATLSSSDTLTVSDTQLVDRGSPPTYVAVAYAGSATIVSLTGGSQVVRTGSAVLEAGVGSIPIQTTTDDEL
jgi:hypothetical protein